MTNKKVMDRRDCENAILSALGLDGQTITELNISFVAGENPIVSVEKIIAAHEVKDIATVLDEYELVKKK